MLILIRFSGEIAVKSPQVRKQFHKQLLRNIKDAFQTAGLDLSISQEWGRLYVRTSHRAGLEVLTHIFGIQSVSAVEEECASDLATIVEVGVARYGTTMRGRTFAVNARRTGKQGFSSMDVQRELGGRLKELSKLTVDLKNPETCVYVEVRPEITYFFSERHKGPGGLPLGSGGKALCLISGGFDSAVAAWMLQKRGVQLDFLLCNLGGEAYERSVLHVAKHLADHWSYGSEPRLHVVDFSELVSHLKEKVTPRYVQVMLKRLFYRTGALLADAGGYEALVTGEAIGQVSSQTLINLRSIENAIELPVLRPLVAFDKHEIIEMSRRIGTYELSAGIQEFCQVVPQRPATACRVATALREEEAVDLSLVQKAVDRAKVLRLRSLSSHELTTPYIFQSEVPQEAVVIDCREKGDYERWHYSGARHHEFYELLANFRTLDKKSTYLVYCGVGMQSALIAEKMQTAGYLAYSFKGGVAELERLAAKRPEPLPSTPVNPPTVAKLSLDNPI